MTTPTQSQIRDALALLQLWRREKNMTHKSMIGVTLTEDAVLDAVEAALSQKPAGDAVREQLSAIQKRLEDAGVLDVKFAISPDGDRSKLAEETITVLEAVLDGKYSPARPLGDSALTGDCGGGDLEPINCLEEAIALSASACYMEGVRAYYDTTWIEALVEASRRYLALTADNAERGE